MAADQVMARVHELGGKLVEFTGGEPLLQESEVLPLVRRLIDAGYRGLLETSGERFVGSLPRGVVKVGDAQCPARGESGKFCFENLTVLDRKDQLKFVIQDENDYRFARTFLADHGILSLVDEVLFSPVFNQLAPQKLAEWILRDGLQVRMGLQLHKFVWDPEMRGV